MQKILVAGAGKSSPWLVKYLLQHAKPKSASWEITIADGNSEATQRLANNHPNARAVTFDINSERERQQLVREADLVISLMPPSLHILLAKDCLLFKKHLITSSYISPEMKELDAAARKEGLMFMCEMGLDPGIDHMTANQIIHSIQRVIGELKSFSSYCGGLVAPENDNNPWHYKFSWNPKNIIDAGKAGASYLKDGEKIEVSYEDMFRKNDIVHVEGLGNLAWYPNRDSLKYLETYEVPDANSFLRATLRHPEFCLGWEAIIRLGATDESMGPDAGANTYKDWMSGLTKYSDQSISLAEHATNFSGVKPREKVLKMLEWLGIFSDKVLPENRSSHAVILLQLLQEKWAMQPDDKDMVVMQHEVHYLHRGQRSKLISTMIVKGENSEYTAMAKTVGLPMGILARHIMKQSIKPIPGVHLPGMPAIYRPILTELAHYDIQFTEKLV